MKDKLEALIRGFREKEGNIISLLQETQAVFGYVPEEAVNYFSGKLGLPASKFFGIATFYGQFHLKPRGKNIITTCCGTACHVKGAEKIINAVKRELKLPDDQDTTEDREFTLEKLACLGTCSLAPAVIIDKKVYGKMTPEKTVKEIKALKRGAHEE